MTAFKERILAHWREFRPTLVRDLERSGELDAVVTSLEQTVLEKQAEVIKRGMSREQADEVVRPDVDGRRTKTPDHRDRVIRLPSPLPITLPPRSFREPYSALQFWCLGVD